MEQVLVSWSGGKDSALALHEILRNGCYEVAALVTTVTENYDRISMHGVRRILLERQAAALGISLETVLISQDATNEEYEARMGALLQRYRQAGILSVVFGDIFLEDLRRYREGKLATIGMKGVFPLWKKDTRLLIRSLAALGYRAITTCVDTAALDARFVGRLIGEEFLSQLPPAVDPCGENGEYHSFVFDGPNFTRPIAYSLGEVVLRRDRFSYCDLLPR